MLLLARSSRFLTVLPGSNLSSLSSLSSIGLPQALPVVSKVKHSHGPLCACNVCFTTKIMCDGDITHRRYFSTTRNLNSDMPGSTPTEVYKGKPDSMTVTSHTTVENTSSGKKMIERINIYKNWNSYSKTKKSFILGYLLMATGAFIFKTYNDGKDALIDYRKETKPEKRTDTELWQKVSDGCSKYMFDNFLASFLFPFTFFSNMMPNLIIAINKEKPAAKTE